MPADLPPLPRDVAMGGLRWTVQETADQMIVFTEHGIAGYADVLMFAKHDGYWRVAVTAPCGSTSAKTIATALEFCHVWRGDDWQPYWPRERYDTQTGWTPGEEARNRHGRAMALARWRAKEPRDA